MLLEMNGIGKSYGAEKILENVSLTLGYGERIGLLGANGAGKSTLLNIIAGELDYDEGTRAVEKDTEIGYLKQNSALNLRNTIGAEASSVFADVYRMGEDLEELRAKLAELPAEGPEHDRALWEYDRLNAAFEAKDGYTLDVKIETVLRGMGFGEFDRSQPVEQLSGGEKTRLAIAKLLLKNPRLLILDEPTNHLDFVTLGWLEEYLSSYKGALIVVSHDRYFLDNVAQSVCELERRTLTRYKGGYSAFVRQKAERREFQQKQYERQQATIAKLQDFADRNIARATTSNMAKSRLKMIEHIEQEAVERPQGDLKTAKMRFDLDVEPYRDVLDAEGLSVSVGEGDQEKRLCQGISLHLTRGEKAAVIGRNGVGKSSLLKALLGELPSKGRIRWGTNVKISYFEQENRQLRPENTVLEELHRRFPRKIELELRTLLGSLLFSGDDIYKRIADLSGGERAKVAFAVMILERSNVLILDEPTNHLDYKTKEILEDALCDYPGTVLMVSHDRYLLNRVPDRILEMYPDRLASYEGHYDDYLRKRAEEGSMVPEKREKPEPEKEGNPYYRSKAQRSEEVRRRNRIAALEREIAELEKRAAALETEASQPETASDYKRLEECCQELEEARAEIARKMDEWLEITSEAVSEQKEGTL